jgi:hypothetical protein
MKHGNLYLGLVLPSGGWQSLIDVSNLFKIEELQRQGLDVSVVENHQNTGDEVTY